MTNHSVTEKTCETGKQNFLTLVFPRLHILFWTYESLKIKILFKNLMFGFVENNKDMPMVQKAKFSGMSSA